MIFVTVGTQLPFDRLMTAVDAWAAAHPEAELFGQTSDLGADHYRPRHFPTAPHLDPAEFRRRCAEAICIVSHAGTGTLIQAMTLGKPILVMPRLAARREHRNDHQLATVDKFCDRPGVHVAATEEEIGPALDRIRTGQGQMPHLAPFAEPRLIEALRMVIHGDTRKVRN